jgi:6-phosphofructokinase 1
MDEFQNITPSDLQIKNLGPCSIPSPLLNQPGRDEKSVRFLDDEDRVLAQSDLKSLRRKLRNQEDLLTFQRSGPRENIFFDPAEARCAIVTCGGLCPGLNDVIRGLVMQLYHRYRVTKIYGIRYGYEGFIPRYRHPALVLHPEAIETIHMMGGTVLGSSRGPQDVEEIADQLVEMQVNMLFAIGGDGSLRGAQEISEVVQRRGLNIAVVGVPKTIDNDIMFVDKSFGFETAFAEAVKSITAAHVEARGAYNGIGLVKLMGRHSGFIASFAALAEGEANFVLIPEVPFRLEGEHGLLAELETRLERRKHAVIVVAEGAGQDLMNEDLGTDASGNQKLSDIGLYLKDRITQHFESKDVPCSLKYIDPSYVIRSVPASPQDSVFCSRLAQNAVHAAMAGRTSMLVGRWHGEFVDLPIHLVTRGRRRVDPNGELWLSVLECTGQKAHMG